MPEPAGLKLPEGITVVLNPSQQRFDQLQKKMSETERWNYRRAEYKLWRSAFERFWFYMAIHIETDSVISAISLALQKDSDGKDLYSIGNYYCVPEWRGKGISNKLFIHVVNLAGKENCTLFGAVEMSHLYAKKFNFSIMANFWHYYADIAVPHLIIPEMPKGFYCKKIEEQDWEKLHIYDETICPLNRREYMKMNLSLAGTISRLVLDESGKIVGFGAIKMATGNELIIAPLYADSLAAATALLSCILSLVPNLKSFNALIAIYPNANANMPPLLSRLTNEYFKTHKAYRHQFNRQLMQFPQNKIYGTDEVSHSPC